MINIVGLVSRVYLDERLTWHLRSQLFVHYEHLSVPFWHREHSGRTMALFSNDVPVVAGFLGSGLIGVLAQVLGLLAGAAAMIRLNPSLAIVVVCVPALVAGAAAMATRPLRAASRAVQDKAAELSERLHESLAGLREIVAFGQEAAESAGLTAAMRELLALRMRLTYFGWGITAGQSLFSLVVMLVLFGVGGYLVINGQATLGALVAMQGLFGQIYPAATALAGTAMGVQRVLASADRLNEFLDMPPRVQERPGARDLDEIRGIVQFEQVSFGYLNDRPVLQDVSLIARPGEVIALVGPSGAGKSTLAALIARFYDPDTGRVLLDGVDLRDITLGSLRGRMAIVFQDSFLFARTVRQNLVFGCPDASEAQIETAARAANAWEFIQELPQGMETPVGQRGAQLSEGQKQRLAIARALLRDPRILILDEPTSALDARSEHLLQEALENLMSGRTTFVIAHRLATVQRADRILVIENGRIREQGTHAELIQLNGLYRELDALQFSGRELQGHLSALDQPKGTVQPHTDSIPVLGHA
jgi:ABC-type multidrug transport system fused ATPase/permease subunit